MDTRPVNVALLRSIECSHNPDWCRTASERVIYGDTAPDFGPSYEIARLVIVCTSCGSVVEMRDVERDCRLSQVESKSGPRD